MGSNIIELAKLGHERAAELKASCGAVDVRSVAQLISDLATQLEVQFVRSTNMAVQLANAESKCRELAAENAELKSGFKYFSYSEMAGFEEHDTAESAMKSADADLSGERDEASSEGWSEETDTICWGVIVQKAVENKFEKPSEENGWIGWSDYALLPPIETPDTDSFLAEVRAQGVESGINTVIAMMNHQHPATSQAIDILQTHAAQLRKGAAL
ncbi:TPA: hypothetical protein ACNV5S_003792 [Citrobacter braakii]